MLLRFDDTDEARSEERWERELQSDLEWIGVRIDDGPVRQSERRARYDEIVQQLLSEDKAWRDDSEGGVIRIRLPENAVFPFHDLVYGRIEVGSHALDEYVLVRSDGTPTYMLASVVDDIDFGITHVLRGADHLTNTSRQLVLFHALGAEPPVWAHLPLLTKRDGQPLSKRDPLGTVGQLRDDGVPAGAVRQYLLELLGMPAADAAAFRDGGGDGAEAPRFDIRRVPPSTPEISPAHLHTLAARELSRMPVSELASAVHARGISVADNQQALVGDLAEGAGSIRELGDLYVQALEPPASDDAAAWRDLVDGDPWALEAAAAATSQNADGDTTVAAIKAAAKARGAGVGSALSCVRVALTGRRSGPALAALLAALGPEEIHARLSAQMGMVQES